ncbi:MAG: GAF domain-containing protein, partial [Lysobacteraceae bacterium]
TAFLVSLPEQLVGVSMLIVFYQNEKRSLERSLLELAGFNLVTTTAQYADTLQEMIGQTLERLLAALHLPAGVMVLDAGGSQISIQRGDVGRFLHQAERLGLLPYLHHTVNRLGGLLVLPEVEQASAAIAFGRKEEFELLQRTARDEGVRMLVAASLRAKSGDQGLLLLASPESRRLAPAELRLLVGLGGQVGMAVENFQLHQQTGRRTEELRLLNEIGRALSSTLTVDELLTCVHAEIQKVLDANNFYVALYDSHTDEVTFALEVRDGHFWPKRQRRAGHGLTEHVLRTKEPLLIRENFSQTIDRLEVESRRDVQSFCAVPILLHGEPTGVIGMFSLTQEKAFDSGHVDILTILAAQMAVAMENARLFAGEQERARQLELLNNVSRRAISTLHPEEMLAAIAAELHLGLPYDHIGLGILDYETREVVIQVEAGHRAQGLNRRFKLG